MRLSRILPLTLAAVLALVLYAPAMGAESAVQGTESTTPTEVYPALPTCLDETGSGVALCTWDAQTQGNGMGNSIVSGDCALSVTITHDVMALCIELHNTQNGVDSVQECNDIENAIVNGIDSREPGFTLYDCYRAMNGM
jgi:hypothetical protein